MTKVVLGGALFALLLVAFASWCGAAADEGTWVTVEAVVPMADRSQAKTRRIALNKVRQLAVAKAVGANLTFMDLYVHTRLDDGGIHAFPHGEIVKSEILTERATVISSGAGSQSSGDYKITLKALVKRSPAVHNPPFRIFARLNKNSFVDGDDMRLHIRSTADCYLKAFVLMEDGRVLKLLPSVLGSATFLPAGKPMAFPSLQENKRGLRLQVHLDESGTTTHEAVYVLALQKPFGKLSEKIKEGIHNLYDGRTALIDELVRHVVTIPPDQRAEALAYYQIRPNQGPAPE